LTQLLLPFVKAGKHISKLLSLTYKFWNCASGIRTTEVVLTHEGLNTPERRALAGAGWPSLLDALAEVLSSPYLDF
jgi:hypothetical protein